MIGKIIFNSHGIRFRSNCSGVERFVNCYERILLKWKLYCAVLKFILAWLLLLKMFFFVLIDSKPATIWLVNEIKIKVKNIFYFYSMYFWKVLMTFRMKQPIVNWFFSPHCFFQGTFLGHRPLISDLTQDDQEWKLFIF